MTTIKVPVTTRDLIKEQADAHGMTQAEFIEHAVREKQRREWLDEVAAWEPDEEYTREFRKWDQADLAPSLLDEYPEERLDKWKARFE